MSDGSLYFPERFSTAEEHLSWWRKVPVPDEVLQHVHEQYPKSRQQVLNIVMDGKFKGIERDPSWSEAEYLERYAEASNEYNSRLNAVRAQMPEQMDRFDVRDAVQLHLAWKYRYTLPAEEQDRLAEEVIELDGRTGTLPAFERYFAMDGYADRNPDAFSRLPDTGADLRAEVAQLRELVARASQDAAMSRDYSGQLLSERLAQTGYSKEQVDLVLAGKDPGPVGSLRAARRSWNR